MFKPVLIGTVLILLSIALVSGAHSSTILSVEDEIHAGNSLVASFMNLNDVGETSQSREIEVYLQKVGDKVAQNSKRKLKYTFHLDLHPGFRSAVAYQGGRIIVGGGVLALMQYEDELAVMLGHEIAHVDLNQCAKRVMSVMERDHLTVEQLDKLSIDDFGKPYGKEGELEADREGLKLAVAAGYSSRAAVELLEVFQFLARDAKPVPPRKDAPSLDERIQQAKDETKSQRWDESKLERALDLP